MELDGVVSASDVKNLQFSLTMKKGMTASPLAGFIMIHSEGCESLYDSFRSDIFASFQKQQTETQTFMSWRLQNTQVERWHISSPV